jgi:hypothetical protein
MQVRFTIKEGEFQYQAEYIGYTTPPVDARMGMGGFSGQYRRSYGELLEAVVRDLTGCPEKIQPTFSKDINPDLQKMTQVALELLVKYNDSQTKIRDTRQILLL